jgi:hypothetical protein
VSPGCNGWQDEAEAEREALEIMDHRCGVMILRAAQRCQQSLVRIERTSGKWKAMTQ